MSFVWIRDDFVAHPKIVQLTDSQLRTWMNLLCWSARFSTRGFVPISIKKEVVGATTKTLAKFTEIRLLDARSDGWLIHDWDEYNGTGKEREQAKIRKQAQRDRERQQRDSDRDNVTPPARDKVTDSLAPARATRDRAEFGVKPLVQAVPLPESEQPPTPDPNERASENAEPAPARNGTAGHETVEDDIDFNVDIPTTIDPVAALRQLGGAA